MKLNITAKSKLWLLLSSSLMTLGVIAMLANTFIRGTPMNFGIDFTGGTSIILRFAHPEDLGKIREVLKTLRLEKSSLQKTGDQNDVIIRTEPLENEKRDELVSRFRAQFIHVELLEADTIGPVVGKELRTQALWSLLLASIGIIIYVSWRFRFDYALAALLALYHDAIITTGLIALFWRTVDTPFIAAILTIMGYSINDTIVIFDRVRENLGKPELKKKPFAELVNISVDQTMSRSINTVLTVLFMNLALLIFGGATIKDFALTLLFGFTIGAYSSICVASPLLVYWQRKQTR